MQISHQLFFFSLSQQMFTGYHLCSQVICGYVSINIFLIIKSAKLKASVFPNYVNPNKNLSSNNNHLDIKPKMHPILMLEEMKMQKSHLSEHKFPVGTTQNFLAWWSLDCLQIHN